MYDYDDNPFEFGKYSTHIHAYIHYITLHYITLHYITLHYITLHYITLHYITLHYITLHYITLHYITLHYITLHSHHITSHHITSHHITSQSHHITLHTSFRHGTHKSVSLKKSSFSFVDPCRGRPRGIWCYLQRGGPATFSPPLLGVDRHILRWWSGCPVTS